MTKAGELAAHGANAATDPASFSGLAVELKEEETVFQGTLSTTARIF